MTRRTRLLEPFQGSDHQRTTPGLAFFLRRVGAGHRCHQHHQDEFHSLADIALERAALGYGRSTEMIRFGTSPTGMRATSFLDATSSTETAFDPASET
jgi:hypothetical protein